MGVCSHGDTERSCKPKVCKLQVVVLVNEKILGFEVTVQDAMRVTVQETGVELVCEFLRKAAISMPSITNATAMES